MRTKIDVCAWLLGSLVAFQAIGCSESEDCPGASCSAPEADGGPPAAAGDAEKPDPADARNGPAEAGEASSGHVDGGTSSEVLSIPSVAIPRGSWNSPFSYRVPHEGGTEPPEFEVVSGKLPKGTGMLRDGTLFGTPYEWGDYQFEVRVTSGSETATRSFDWRIVTSLWLAYRSDDREVAKPELFLTNIGAGQPYKGTPMGVVDGFQWLNRSTIEYDTATDSSRSVFASDVSEAGVEEPVKIWEGAPDCWRVWSPDGNTLAVVCDKAVTLVPRDAPDEATTFGLSVRPRFVEWAPDSSRMLLLARDASDNYFGTMARRRGEISLTFVPLELGSGQKSLNRLEWAPYAKGVLLDVRLDNGTTNDLFYLDARLPASVASPLRVNQNATPARVLFAGWTPDGRVAYAQPSVQYTDEYDLLTRLPEDASDAARKVTSFRASTDNIQSVNLVREDTAVALTRASGASDPEARYQIETLSPNNAREPYLVEPRYAISSDLKHTLTVADRYETPELGLGTDLSWNDRTISYPENGNTFLEYTFSPDGTRVFFLQKKAESGALPYYADLRSGDPHGVPLVTEGAALESNWWGRFSPDSRFVAYVVRRNGPIDLEVVDLSAQVPSRPRNVNGPGRVEPWSWCWQPAWP